MNPLVDPTPTIEWNDKCVKMIDQTKLPLKEEYIETDDYKVVCDAIYRLAIRGAPAIGVAGAYACVLSANKITSNNQEGFIKEFLVQADEIENTRPTAVNLKWAVRQMKEKVKKPDKNITEIKRNLLKLAHQIKDDDLNRCHSLGLHGAELIPDNEVDNLLSEERNSDSLKEKILGEYKRRRSYKFDNRYDIRNTISEFLKLPFFDD